MFAQIRLTPSPVCMTFSLPIALLPTQAKVIIIAHSYFCCDEPLVNWFVCKIYDGNRNVFVMLAYDLVL